MGIPLQTTFSFTVGSTSTTSAGVFDSSGNLVRTLWSNVQYAAGTYTATWDGTLDGLTGIGSVASTGAYTIKVLSSQVAYAWQGVVGNTSDSYTNSTTLRALGIMLGMAISGTNIYYCTGYNEADPSAYKVSTSDPQSKTFILPTHNSTNIFYVATDGTNVYWAANDPLSAANGSWVFGTTVAADAAVTFSAGVTVTTVDGGSYSGIDQVTATGNGITGLAVQSGGLGYVCVARGNFGAGTIDILNKTTGALINSTSSTGLVSGLACDGSNGLWLIAGTAIFKYTINSDGTITYTGLDITGFSAPLAVAVSPDGTTVLVADGGSSQQVKAFNTTTGASTWIYGVAGGYSSSPAVANNKFYFYSAPGETFSTGAPWAYLAFQSDGSFWVGDPGNCRTQYFTAGPTPTWANTIMWLPSFYSCNVDPNNPVRLFAHALEFQIDYTKTLGPANGSWTLVNNWLPNIIANNPPYYDKYYLLSGVATLSNGRTYAQLHNTSTSKLQTVELVAGSGLRFTGVLTPNILYNMVANGDWNTVTFPIVLGNPIVFSKQPLTGFDGSNNPLYGALTTVATSPAVIANGPAWYESAGMFSLPWYQTTSGIIPVFDSFIPRTHPSDAASHAGWHLGGLNVSTGAYQWQASPAGPANYLGAWMTDGTYEVGNLATNAGSKTNVLGRNIFYQYYGELWKAGETNEYSHFWDDGLMVGQFGTTSPPPHAQGQAGMAGNAFGNTVVQDASGGVHVYHNDESYHGGAHRWDITGLSTIAEQSFSCQWYSFQYNAVSDPTDMLAGLPYSASVVSGTPAAWTYSPTTQITTSQVTNYWTLTTNVLEHNTRLSPDIFMNFAQSSAASPAPPFTATLTLPTPSPSTTSWTLSSTIAWFGQNIPTDGVYFDILDNSTPTPLIITRIYPNQITPGSSYSLIANGQTVFNVSTAAAMQAIVNAPTALTISAVGTVLTIAYTGYAPITASVFNPSAIWNEPASIVMTFFSTTTSNYQSHKIGFQTLHFSHVP